MTYTITEDVVDNINSDRFKKLLKNYGLPVSGSKKELVERIRLSVNGELEGSTLTVEVFDRFLSEEISHGKNRMLFVSLFPKESSRRLRSIRSVHTSLATQGFPTENFNNLRTVSRPDNTQLVYLNIDEEEENVRNISMCFAKKTVIKGLLDEEGEELPPRFETDYIWAEILPDKETLIIKMRPRTSNYFENNSKSKELYEEISTKVREVFSLAPRTIESAKHTFYKIFKDLTQTAEKPFREIVEPLQDELRQFAEKCAEKIGLPNSMDPVNLPYRLFRLLERALIQKDFDVYESYFEGKKGIINRMYFSDPTGASVNARSGHADDGIAVADIYFDTRDTIEELKKFDKLWVTWFNKTSPDKPVDKIETKFEAFKEHYVVHFLYAYTTKEVEKLVLSNIEYYENLPDR